MAHRILIVEDSSVNGNLLTMLLEDNGYEPSWVTTGEECLSLATKESFDLVLMDISLPGIDGREATKQLREIEHYRNTPIIACTIYGLEDDEMDIMSSGINAVVHKPFDEQQLTEELSRWLT